MSKQTLVFVFYKGLHRFLYWQAAESVQANKFILKSVVQFVVDEPAETLTAPPVFLDKKQASELISRQKRNVDGSNPASPASLEQVCMEKVCTYEQARSVFQDSYRTVSSRVSLFLCFVYFSRYFMNAMHCVNDREKAMCSSNCALIIHIFSCRISSGLSTLVSAVLK